MKSIKSMALEELLTTKAMIEAAIQRHIAGDNRELVKAIESLATGIAGNRLSQEKTHGHALKGKKLPAKYRNPKNHAETWAGRGNRPRWLVAALKNGKKLDALVVR